MLMAEQTVEIFYRECELLQTRLIYIHTEQLYFTICAHRRWTKNVFKLTHSWYTLWFCLAVKLDSISVDTVTLQFLATGTVLQKVPSYSVK